MGRCSCGGLGCACVLQGSGAIAVTGTGTVGSPFVVSSTGTDTSVTAGDGIDVAGTGASGTPYVVSVERIEEVNTVAAAGATETLPDVDLATIHHLTLDADITLTFPTAVAGKSFTLVLKQDATGSRLATWPGTVLWTGGATPTLTTTAAKSDIFTFLCADGTNWLGFFAGADY